MTSSELKDLMRDIDIKDPFKRDFLGLWIGIALVDCLEQIREEMITRMPLLEEKDENFRPDLVLGPNAFDLLS